MEKDENLQPETLHLPIRIGQVDLALPRGQRQDQLKEVFLALLGWHMLAPR